jgi:hypothetical protein
MEVSGQLQAPAALFPGKEPLVPIRYEAGWAPEPIWMRWWRGNFPTPAGTRTPDHLARRSTLFALLVQNRRTESKLIFRIQCHYLDSCFSIVVLIHFWDSCVYVIPNSTSCIQWFIDYRDVSQSNFVSEIIQISKVLFSVKLWSCKHIFFHKVTWGFIRQLEIC